jgi:hypothetical protein
MFMQEFSYSIVHVKGENNFVADTLLRLCPDFMHNDAESERHDSESVDVLAAFWAANRWSPVDESSTSCAVLEEPVEEEGQQPDLMVDTDTFRIIRSAHTHEVGYHGVERTILKLRKCNTRSQECVQGLSISSALERFARR